MMFNHTGMFHLKSPPNFLRAAALAEYKRPVVIVGTQEPQEEEEAEPQPEVRDTPQNQQV